MSIVFLLLAAMFGIVATAVILYLADYPRDRKVKKHGRRGNPKHRAKMREQKRAKRLRLSSVKEEKRRKNIVSRKARKFFRETGGKAAKREQSRLAAIATRAAAREKAAELARSARANHMAWEVKALASRMAMFPEDYTSLANIAKNEMKKRNSSEKTRKSNAAKARAKAVASRKEAKAIRDAAYTARRIARFERERLSFANYISWQKAYEKYEARKASQKQNNKDVGKATEVAFDFFTDVEDTLNWSLV